MNDTRIKIAGFLQIACILLCRLPAQSLVTFQVNMQPLIDQNLFLPDYHEGLFVRGSFNNWQGFDYELIKKAESGIFHGTFLIDAGVTDTVEYKFVIRNSENRIVWERNPNPENIHYGNREFIITADSLALPVTMFDYDEYIRFPVVFDRKKLQEDFRQMREIIESIHPALYDYTSKQTLDSLFDIGYKQIDEDLDFNRFYFILSSILSRIGCGHTKLWIPPEYWRMVPDKLFPLQIKKIDEHFYVSGCYSDSAEIPVGSELVDINDVPIQNVVEHLKGIESSDGFIEAFQSAIVQKKFPEKYALIFGYPDRFLIRYTAPGESIIRKKTLVPVSIETIHQIPDRGNTLALNRLNSRTAILTINTFIYYDKQDMFRSFIDSTFTVIQKNRVPNLIIDLRGNDGGDPYCASCLLSYIEKKPVPYFAEPYSRYTELAEPIRPAGKNRFQGNLYILIDGGIFSTTGHFAALLKYHKIGLLIGSETGATYTCTGSVQYVNLKNTRLILASARKNRYTAAVKNMDRTRGIEPDYPIGQTREDLIDGKDTVMNFVLDLIRQSE